MRLMISFALATVAVAWGLAVVPMRVSTIRAADCGSVKGTDSLYNWCGDWLSGDCNNVVGNSDYPPCGTGECDECSRNYSLSSCFLQTGYTCFYDIFDCGRLEKGTCDAKSVCVTVTDVRDCNDIQIALVNCP